VYRHWLANYRVDESCQFIEEFEFIGNSPTCPQTHCQNGVCRQSPYLVGRARSDDQILAGELVKGFDKEWQAGGAAPDDELAEVGGGVGGEDVEDGVAEGG